ncbi:MAG TPA: adenylate/guanylate cyclase domain-containing protein [Candidatus Binatia bacterium]|nr:adenylate/guanylate cyclase domain-containing protein [Candidatus Binatia bacterium]
MKCYRCQAEVPTDADFCPECGTKLAVVCGNCKAENAPSHKFCKKCGQPLAATSAQSSETTKFSSPEFYTPKYLAEKILTSKSALEGERKQVTVLFADMKGSMELLADRDPEEARRLLDPIIGHMMEAVHRYEGTVNQVMGDGIMALFGAPLAHEDHAVRACYAALKMQDYVKSYAEEVQRREGIPIQIRVGLNSGEVVVRSVGSDLKMDYTAVGQTTNLAARMEQMAMPGSVLITADTLRLTEGFVQVRSLGPVNVKGMSEPVDVHNITGAGPVRSRLQAAAARGLTRFVGRDAELDTLRQTLEKANSGQGQVVALVGEPGVGKSRLFWEFTHSRRTASCLILESSSVSYGKATAYLPIIDLLKEYFGLEERDEARKIREKVTGKLLTLDETLKPTLPAFLALFDVAVEDEQWKNLDPPERRRRTLDAIKRLLLRESQIQPLLLVVEDLHWIDSETQAFLESLIESLPTTRILLLVNYRPEYQHAWGSKTYYSQLRIDPLPPESAGELLGAVLGNDVALQPLKELLIERTEGNPFFLEESVRTLVETGVLVGERGNYSLARPIESTQVPATVQAVLAARIDRLSPEEKRLLQTAAVIGKDVPFALLQAISDQPEEELRRCLARLQTAEFLYETSLFPDLEYTFKHALTHEVTHGSVLQERRRALHAQIVEAMEKLYPDRATEYVELLAHHASRGKQWEKAARYLHQAGRKAAGRSAHKEAASYFEQALKALGHLPETHETLKQAVNIRIELAPAVIATSGFAAPGLERIYVEARALCERLGETPQLFPVLWGLARVYDTRGELKRGSELGGQLLASAERLQDPALILEAHHELWANLSDLGEFSAALTHTKHGIEIYDAERHRQHAFLYGGHDPGVCGLRHAAMMLFLLGYPDQALQKSADALALAQKLSHPNSLAFALYYSAWVHQQRGETQLVEERLEKSVTLATEQGLTRWLHQGNFLQGWVLVQQGKGQEGILKMRRPITVGVREQSYYVTRLADAFGKEGHVDDGLTIVTDELARVQIAGTRLYEAELHRIKGDLLLQSGVQSLESRVQEAETCFQEAIKIARGQEAKSLELRAVTSLSRLWQKQGKKEEARQMLADIYSWFTEGFDTADLKAAKTLLDELS